MITWMLYAIAVGALLGLAAAATERLMLAGGRSTRWVWLAALAGSISLPIALPLLARGSEAGGLAAGGGSVAARLGALEVLEAAPGGADPYWVERVLAVGWLASSVALAVLFAWSLLVLRARRREWQRGRVAGVRVLVSSSTGPALVGFLAPELVVPKWMMDLDARSLRLLVTHEEEHLVSRDPLLLLVGMSMVVAMPWNLPLWWQAQRLRLATEVDCDARVLRRHPDPREYGMLLLEVGRLASSGRLAAAAFSEPRSFLERRVAMLTGRRSLPPSGGVLLMAAAVVGVAAACAIPSPDAPEPSAILGPGPVGAVEPGTPGPAAPSDTIPRRPTFTPYDVRPELRDRAAVADLLERVYPPMLRDAGVGGTAILWVYVDQSGAVRNTRVVTSSGYEELDAAAEAAARDFSFSPAQNRGEPVPVWIQLPITFGARSAAAAPPAERAAETPAARAAPASEPAPAPEAAPTRPDAPAARAAGEAPSFTPYEFRPELQNRREFSRILAEAYPPMLKDAGVQGTATYWVFIDEEGSVGSVRLVRSTGYEQLDEAGRGVLLQAEFSPAMLRGRPVGVWIQLPITFQVRGDG